MFKSKAGKYFAMSAIIIIASFYSCNTFKNRESQDDSLDDIYGLINSIYDTSISKTILSDDILYIQDFEIDRIESLPDSLLNKNERKYIIAHLNKNQLDRWDSTKIKKKYSVLSDNYLRTFNHPTIPEGDCVIHLNYLDYYKCSQPYFSENKQKALMKEVHCCGPLCGSSIWALYAKKNGRWIKIYEIMISIS